MATPPWARVPNLLTGYESHLPVHNGPMGVAVKAGSLPVILVGNRSRRGWDGAASATSKFQQAQRNAQQQRGLICPVSHADHDPGITSSVIDCAGNFVPIVLAVPPPVGGVTVTFGCATIAFRLALL